MKRPRWRWGLPAVAAGLLAVAGVRAGDSGDESAPAMADWLILSYFAGDNDLDPFGMQDIREMEAVGSTERVKIVALIDRAEESEWSTARRFLVHKRDTNDDTPSWDPARPTCEDIGEVNTGAAATLRGFVEWARARYPARQQVLIISNHGGGWREAVAKAARLPVGKGGDDPATGAALFGKGIGWDWSSDHDFLESREVCAALADLPPFAVIGADACLMAMLEVAYEWRGLADYYVASEESEPGDGWPFVPILGRLVKQPEVSPEEFARSIVRDFGARYENDKHKTTLSAVRLAQVEPLAKAVSRLAGEFSGAATRGESFPDIWQVTRFGAGKPFSDIGGILRAAANTDGVSANLANAALDAQQCLAQAVMENYTHPDLKASGLSIFTYGTKPDERGDYRAEIIQFAKDTEWDEFLPLLEKARSLVKRETPGAPGPEAASAATAADWLFMVYYAVDNNLDPFAIPDIREMERVGSSDRVKIVVFIDRAADSEWSTARRFLVLKRGKEDAQRSWDTSLPTCEDVGELNTGDPATLKQFITWARTKYPAKRQMLTISNHGGGWRAVMAKAAGLKAVAGEAVPVESALLSKGIGWDDSSGSDFLESREVRAVLQEVGPFTVLGADACLMAMLEVAYEWRAGAEYYVASEEVEPGEGWPFDPVLSGLVRKPEMSGEELARNIVRHFGELYDGRQERTTLSAVRLAQVEPLAKAMSALGDQLGALAQKGGDFPPVWQATRFGSSEGFSDIAGMLRRVRDAKNVGKDVQKAAADAQQCLDQAVIENRSHPELKAGGLSIFTYGKKNDERSDYREDIIQFAKDTKWDEFLPLLDKARQSSGGGQPAPTERPTESGGGGVVSGLVGGLVDGVVGGLVGGPVGMVIGVARRWAVLIGVGDYDDKDVPDLKYSEKDAELMRKVLVEQAGYQPENVKMLLGKDATIESVRSYLGTTLPRQVGEKDMVFIYFSGHGAAEPSIKGDSSDGTEKYVLLRDSKIDNLYGSALPMSELSRIFERIQADKLLLVMDTCYSGASGGKGVLRSGMKAVGLSDDYLERLGGSAGTVVLTASRANEVSMESKAYEHGVFTYHLGQALSGAADFNHDGVLQISEIYQYVNQTVPADSKKMGAAQHPVLRGEFTGEFPVALVRGGKDDQVTSPRDPVNSQPTPASAPMAGVPAAMPSAPVAAVPAPAAVPAVAAVVPAVPVVPAMPSAVPAPGAPAPAVPVTPALPVTPPRLAPRLVLAGAGTKAGGTLAVRIEDFAAGNAAAWIGLYRLGADSRNYEHYTFVNNLTDGLYDTSAPRAPGRYEVRLFADEGYNPVAVSAPIDVQ